MKQTSVEWLIEQIKSDQNQKELSASEWVEVVEKAKEMNKQEIIDAWYNGASSDPLPTVKNAEKYYEHTFKN